MDGARADVVSYLYDGTSVAVALRIAGAKPTGAGRDSPANIENVVGTHGAEWLRGDGGPNLLLAYGGSDLLEGRGGEDVLDGGADADSLDVRDGGPDLADRGPAADTPVWTSGDWTRSSTARRSCSPGGRRRRHGDRHQRRPDRHDGRPLRPDRLADRRSPGALLLGRVKADPARFPARERDTRRAAARGTTFRYSLSEPATVTFTIKRHTSGHTVKGSCWRRPARTPAGRCGRFVRVGSFRAPAGAGANGTPFSGRLAAKPLRPGPYRALLDAVDAAGNRSRRATASFTVLRAKPRERDR